MIGDVVEVVRIAVLLVGHHAHNILIGGEFGEDFVDGADIVVVAAEDIGSQHDVELAVVEHPGFTQIVHNILFVVITDIGHGNGMGLFGDTDDAVDISSGETAGAPLLKDTDIFTLSSEE